MSTWVEAHAEDLQVGDAFRFEGEDPSLAHVVSTPVRQQPDSWVRFCTHLSISDSPEGLTIIPGTTTVYVLGTDGEHRS